MSGIAGNDNKMMRFCKARYNRICHTRMVSSHYGSGF